MPQLLLPLFAVAAGLAYWLGKRRASNRLAHMKEDTDSVKGQNDLVNQRLGLASDKERTVAEKLQEAEIELANLRYRISELSGSVPADTAEMLAASAALVATNIHAVAAASNELRQILSDDRAVGAYG